MMILLLLLLLRGDVEDPGRDGHQAVSDVRPELQRGLELAGVVVAFSDQRWRDDEACGRGCELAATLLHPLAARIRRCPPHPQQGKPGVVAEVSPEDFGGCTAETGFGSRNERNGGCTGDAEVTEAAEDLRIIRCLVEQRKFGSHFGKGHGGGARGIPD